jgi:hypothetical protein
MKLTTMVFVAATGLLLATGYAVAENKQQDKMQTCNDLAKRKGLKGDERKEFMKTCLSAGGGEVADKPHSQQDKMKACNKVAKAKDLKGNERETFMKDCLSGK